MAVFQSMHLDVVGVQDGVYHLQKSVPGLPQPLDFIGLLYSPQPMEVATYVKLFLQPVPEGVEPSRIQRHWASLDARRLEESGLEPIELVVDGAALPPCPAGSIKRPDGEGLRFLAQLPTGEFVCYT